MRAAIIVDGKVDNIIEVDTLDALEGVELIEASMANIGDDWDGEKFTTPDLEPQPVVIPATVTRRQARQALLLADLLDDVPVAIAALDDGTPEGKQQMRMAQIEWEDSLEFERARPLVIQIAAAIGLDAGALDQLFVTAAGL
jgi:hypothetical protein